jgi:excisionase family DNA binding protein
MNAIVLSDFNEALRLVDGDKAAATMLVLAAALRESQPVTDTALTVHQAARRLKVAPNTVYGLVETGKLKHHRIGRTIRILPADIDSYQRQETDATRPQSRPGKYHFDL